MDRNYLTELFGGREFPNGEFAIDHIEGIIEHQKVFMEVVSEVRKETMTTFPVLTYSLLYKDGKFVDEDFARWCNRHNMEWFDSNFYVGNDVTSLSNCCFHGSQSVLVKVGEAITLAHFDQLESAFNADRYKVYHKGEWKDGTLVKLPARPLYKIKTIKGRELIVTDNHINPTERGDITTVNLELGDRLLIYGGESDTITYKEFYYDTDELVYCFEMDDQNDPYFTLGNNIITHNCRLISDTSKLNAFINSIGGTSLSIGSVKVNTINLRRIALESEKDQVRYVEILTDRIDLCVKTLDIVRDIITRNIEKGLLPNYTHGLIELEKQYNTIGATAMYEAVEHFGYIDEDEFGNKSYSEEGLKFAQLILNTINDQKETYGFDYSINLEMIPAERCNVVLCNKDNELYPADNKYFIYSNQWIPLMDKCTIQEKIKLGALLDRECGGGQISHINLEGKFANEEQAWELLNRIAQAGVIYFAYNTQISVCENEHGFFGEVCPRCESPKIDTYSRIVGFLVPFSSYSKERKQEFSKRQWFSIGNDL